MTIMNLMIGFPTMLLCMIVQVALSFWAVRYYVRHAWGTPAPRRFLAGIRPLLVIMLAMTAGNFVQIAVWIPTVWQESSTRRPSTIPRSIRLAAAISS
jgi:hypothetical protein